MVKMTKADYDKFWDYLLDTTGAMFWIKHGTIISCVQIALRQYDETK